MSNGIARNTQQRLLLLCLCLLSGSAIGFVGQYLTGSAAWFLGIPAVVLAGWFFVANPTECLPPNERPSHNGSGH
jgi:hypothetical protein